MIFLRYLCCALFLLTEFTFERSCPCMCIATITNRVSWSTYPFCLFLVSVLSYRVCCEACGSGANLALFKVGHGRTSDGRRGRQDNLYTYRFSCSGQNQLSAISVLCKRKFVPIPLNPFPKGKSISFPVYPVLQFSSDSVP